MRVDFLGLEAFLSIAERGSFHRAAAHLNLSQTALSHRMKKFEEDLGLKLLARTTRQVSLTPSGLDLLPRARAMMEEIAASLEDLRAKGQGHQARLGIGCLPTLAITCLPPILAEFAKTYPHLKIKVYDNSATEIAERVQTGDAEFGITIVSSNRWDLELRPVLKEPFMLVCRKDHAFAKHAAISWAELEGEPLVRISQTTGNRALIDEALAGKRDSLNWRYECQHVATALAMARTGVALTILPRLALALAQQGDIAAQGRAGENASQTQLPTLNPGSDIVAIPLRFPNVSRTLGLVYRRSQPVSTPAEALMALVEKQLKTYGKLTKDAIE